ncbi:MAG: metal-sulfur cluster assembly factor [Saprospiraceae bacterium]|nr:metal-sulfur cluster assembly factor [Saprospiraceae bacterium]
MNGMNANERHGLRAAEALQEVLDPEVNLNIVDLGLVYGIEVDPQERKLRCVLTLTTQFCPMGGSIVDGARVALERAFEGYAVDVDLKFDPPWAYGMISEAGRQFLNA